MGRYVIMAESGADIPRETVEKYGIHIVPMHVTMGEETRDDGTFPIDEVYQFYDRTGVLPKTSGSNVQDFERAFDEVHSQDPDAHIIYLAYSAVTTVSFQSAQIAAEGRDYVTAIDTKQVSAGQYLAVMLTIEHMKEHPEESPAEIREWVGSHREKIHMAFLPDTLKYLRAGGRVSNAQYLGASLLNLHPEIEIIGGELTAAKKYRGPMTKIYPKFFRDFDEKWHFDRKLIIIVHTPRMAQKARDGIVPFLKEQGFEQIRWIPCGCVVSVHGGPGAFGFCGAECF